MSRSMLKLIDLIEEADVTDELDVSLHLVVRDKQGVLHHLRKDDIMFAYSEGQIILEME